MERKGVGMAFPLKKALGLNIFSNIQIYWDHSLSVSSDMCKNKPCSKSVHHGRREPWDNGQSVP